jgi:hypothetical protein
VGHAGGSLCGRHSFNGRSIRDELQEEMTEADRKAGRVTERRKRAG